MKVSSFRIENYKSVIDTEEVYLGKSDNILILAGQNESGKSSILQALRDYGRSKLDADADNLTSNKKAYIHVVYSLSNKENLIDLLGDSIDLTKLPKFSTFLKKLESITFFIDFNSWNERFIKEFCEYDFENDFSPSSNDIDENQLNSEEKQFNTTKEGIIEKLVDEIWKLTPEIVLFSDMQSLLPSTIPLSALSNKTETVEGYIAVKNYENILGKDLVNFSTNSDGANESLVDDMNNTISVEFNVHWKQKIYGDNKVDIKIKYYQGGNGKEPYFGFYILTKDGEYLKPSQRSEGLKWFLSFYLELESRKKEGRQFFILLDEPGLFLHSKAQGDIKDLLEEISSKHQIIYSTHSPYLIDTSRLNRVRLIINDKEKGTCVEKITTQKTGAQTDALKPIIDAMGIELASGFSHTSKNNVILEGISDLYYIEGMRKLLGYNYDKKEFSCIPASGVNKVNIIISFCIGWGISWCAVMDGDTQSNNEFKNIKKGFGEDSVNKIYKKDGIDGIEDIFLFNELNKISSDFDFKESEENSKKVKELGGKEIVARFFLEKINSGELVKKDFSEYTINNFKEIFSFIFEQFDIKK